MITDYRTGNNSLISPHNKSPTFYFFFLGQGIPACLRLPILDFVRW